LPISEMKPIDLIRYVMTAGNVLLLFFHLKFNSSLLL